MVSVFWRPEEIVNNSQNRNYKSQILSLPLFLLLLFHLLFNLILLFIGNLFVMLFAFLFIFSFLLFPFHLLSLWNYVLAYFPPKEQAWRRKIELPNIISTRHDGQLWFLYFIFWDVKRKAKQKKLNLRWKKSRGQLFSFII